MRRAHDLTKTTQIEEKQRVEGLQMEVDRLRTQLIQRPSSNIGVVDSDSDLRVELERERQRSRHLESERLMLMKQI